MTEPTLPRSTRREFLKDTGKVAAVSALAGVALPHVHAGENNTIQLALVGCGGRGTGAVVDAFTDKSGPIKLVAMADVFEDRLKNSHKILKERFGSQVDVPADRQFIGFDGYRKAMDCLRKGDIVMLTTPPAFRWVQFDYAIPKGINVFMEKPVTVDGPSTRKLLALADASVKANIKVGVGLMCRHCEVRQELFKRVKAGEVGYLVTLRCYRLVGGGGFTGPKPKDISELMYQVQKFHSFMWASGGVFMDYLIHNIDECCWMKDAWPVQAQANGGREYRGDNIDQNFDHYSVEYTFGDGTKLFVGARNMPGCHQEFASYGHGTKGLAVISTARHTPAKSMIFKGHQADKSRIVWRGPAKEPNPYEVEWHDLIRAIREDRPYNEAKRGAEASVVTAMGRAAAHTGQIITWDDIMNSKHEFGPGVDKLTLDSPAPLQVGKDGHYPMPQPGRLRKREF